MKYYDIMTPHTANEVSEWYHKAMNDETVSRFLSGSPYQSLDLPDTSSWESVFLMDKKRKGLVWLKADHQPSGCVSFGCHVLDVPGKAFAAGALLHAARSVAKNNMAGQWLEWIVHATNKDSLRASEHMCRVWNGLQWGRKSSYLWDSRIGTLVDGLHFRIRL